ncbi:MAG: nucleotidyl transferase AbiEii/AbiGii toxin family protein [Saprospiraceae bacterium]|nr:nucleotidyl transferase AbiEii/AbiGii toxin family protein [Saprospiraceae bacterium]
MQEVVLAGLARSGFFKHATFYGGTALRIFHKLDRYSEDLDFSLNYVDENFSLIPFFEGIKDEFALLGLDVDITLKQRKSISPIESAFLKENTVWGLITLDEKYRKATNFPNIKIKIEIDKTPPLKFNTEQLLLTKPYTFYVSCMTVESLFAGKMHAVLFREWKSRVKGRDWYDLEWYIKKGVQLRLDELTDRGLNSGHIKTSKKSISVKDFQNLMLNRIQNLDVEKARFDIRQFVTNQDDLHIWSFQYFNDLVAHIKFS